MGGSQPLIPCSHWISAGADIAARDSAPSLVLATARETSEEETMLVRSCCMLNMNAAAQPRHGL